MAEQGMAIVDVREAIEWQARHAEEAGAACTGRVIRAELAILDSDTATGLRMANWHGLVLADAMPLRIAGGLHWLCLSGKDTRLQPVYAGLLTDQDTIDAIVADMAARCDAQLMAWLDSPPHRALLLDCRLRLVGLGVQSVGSQLWWTIDLVRRR